MPTMFQSTPPALYFVVRWTVEGNSASQALTRFRTEDTWRHDREDGYIWIPWSRNSFHYIVHNKIRRTWRKWDEAYYSSNDIRDWRCSIHLSDHLHTLGWTLQLSSLQSINTILLNPSTKLKILMLIWHQRRIVRTKRTHWAHWVCTRAITRIIKGVSFLGARECDKAT